jgi:hypothetical protein
MCIPDVPSDAMYIHVCAYISFPARIAGTADGERLVSVAAASLDISKYAHAVRNAMNDSGIFTVGGVEIRYAHEVGRGRSVRLRFDGDQLVVTAPRGTDVREAVSCNWRWVYRNHARMRRALDDASVAGLEKRDEADFKRLALWLVELYSSELGVKPGKVSFKLMRSKWGSCSSTGGISINLALRHLPERLVRYVAFHEVSHLAELNHGKAFWGIVSRRFPDLKAIEDELLAYWFVVCRIYDF